MNRLPPFPIDDQALDLIEAALDVKATGRSSIPELCRLYSEMGGSDLNAYTDVEIINGIECRTMRDQGYHANSIIAALVAEVRRLRGANA